MSLQEGLILGENKLEEQVTISDSQADHIHIEEIYSKLLIVFKSLFQHNVRLLMDLQKVQLVFPSYALFFCSSYLNLMNNQLHFTAQTPRSQ